MSLSIRKDKEPKETDENVKLDQFVVEAFKYRTVIPERIKNKKPYEPDNPKQITAFIPGTIVKIDVKEGQQVKEGDRLMVLDAMKMHNNIFTSIDGRVKKINVGEGERVPKKFVIIELE